MLILAKILVTFLTVILLAKVAERMSPRHAGLLAGFPLGTAIALYFFGWQQGEQFAAQSAVYTLPGLAAAICLAWGYQQVIQRKPQLSFLPLAIASGLLCFFLAASTLQLLPQHRGINLLVVIGAILLFRTLFKSIQDSLISPPVNKQSQSDESQNTECETNKLSRMLSNKWLTLLFRASIATASILLITALAEVLGPQRAGLLAAFPVSFFPLMLILHISYGATVLSTSIKHYPDGIGALVVYCLAVSSLYPLLGLHWGTISSLLCSVFYLVVYGQIRNRFLSS